MYFICPLQYHTLNINNIYNLYFVVLYSIYGSTLEYTTQQYNNTMVYIL